MGAAIISAFAAILGTVVGGFVTYFIQKEQFVHNMKLMREQYKTQFMAETTAKHFLNHKSYTDRSFDTLKKHLGGFEDDELRKILVRAGAIRVYRGEGENTEEWWRLLSRMGEFIERKREG